MSDRLSNMSGNTELLIDDSVSVVSVVPETPVDAMASPSWADSVPDDPAPAVSPELFPKSLGCDIPLPHFGRPDEFWCPLRSGPC